MTIKVITPKKAGSRPPAACPYLVDDNTGGNRR